MSMIFYANQILNLFLIIEVNLLNRFIFMCLYYLRLATLNNPWEVDRK